jgi:hypothetical protein
MQTQVNVARPTAINEVYPLTGAEAAGIRAEVVKATTTDSKQAVDVLHGKGE